MGKPLAIHTQSHTAMIDYGPCNGIPQETCQIPNHAKPLGCFKMIPTIIIDAIYIYIIYIYIYIYILPQDDSSHISPQIPTKSHKYVHSKQSSELINRHDIYIYIYICVYIYIYMYLCILYIRCKHFPLKSLLLSKDCLAMLAVLFEVA